MITTSKQVQANAEKIVSEWSENSKKGWMNTERLSDRLKAGRRAIQPIK